MSITFGLSSMDVPKWARLALDNIAEIIAALDNNGKIIAINRACLHRWGYREEELMGKELASFIAPESVSTMIGAIKTGRKESPAKFFFDTSVICSDGSESFVLWTASWPEEENVLFLVSCHDSSFSYAQEAIRASEARIRTIINHMIAGLVIVKNNGNIESMNPRAEAIFGYHAKEIEGEFFSKLFDSKPDQLDETLFLEAFIASALNKLCDTTCLC